MAQGLCTKPHQRIQGSGTIDLALVRRMVKQNWWTQYRRIKTPRISERTRKWRTERSGALAKRFSHKRSVKKCVFQEDIKHIFKSISFQKSIKYWNERTGSSLRFSLVSSIKLGLRLLGEAVENRFTKNTEMPPASPDSNSLDYYFWDRHEWKVYEN